MQYLHTLRSSAARALGVGAMSLFWLACDGEDVNAPTTGEIRVTISTSSAGHDPDGYTLTLDGQPSRAVSIDASLSLAVEQGVHVVELGAVEPHCSVAGGTRREVEVTVGGVVSVAFEVLCGPTTGGLRITTATTGGQLDPDGYSLTIDGGNPQPIGLNETLVFPELSPGDHTVQLSGLAENCSTTTANPLVIGVPVGATAEAAFEIFCTASIEQWTPLASGTGADLLDVWGSSPTDMFVVGEELSEEPFEVASVIRHYNGTGWDQQLRQVDLELQGIWGSSATDVYAVGFDFFSPVAKVLHYNGVQWTDIPGFIPGPFEESILFQSVWGSSSTDVFAVGSSFNGFFDVSLIFHFNGAFWLRQAVAGSVQPALVDVWGSSPTNVYAVGHDDVNEPSSGVILRYDGSTWTSVHEEEDLAPTSLWGSSATDIFVAGFQIGEDFQVSGTILHFDGTNWSHMQVPVVGILNEIWGSSATNVFAVGEAGVILHYDGVEWTATNPATLDLIGIWGTSSSDGLAVGLEGTVLHGTP